MIFCINIFPVQNCSNSNSFWISDKENPFKTYYADPKMIHDMVIDPDSNIMYIGCEYGVIIKNLTTNDFKVISYFDGLENSNVEAIELDKRNSRLYILVLNCNDIFVLDLNSFEIVEKFSLDSNATLADAVYFKQILFDTENDNLYLGSDAGLAELNLTSKEFTFYDIFFFEINFSKFEKTKNKIHVETDEYFSINGFDYCPKTNELYIATSHGLTIFNTSSKNFLNFRNNSQLSGRIYDVLFEKSNNYLLITKESLLRFDLKTYEISTYPSIWDNNSSNTNMYSITLDNKRDLIYTTLHNYESSIAIFDKYDFRIIKTFTHKNNSGLIRPITKTFPHVCYNPTNDKIYLGLGPMKTLTGTKWEINYTINKKSRIIKSENSEYLYWEINKRLECKKRSVTHITSSNLGSGLVLFSYDYDSDKFSLINITNNKMIAKDSCPINNVNVKIHPRTGITFIYDSDKLIIFNSNGELLTSIDKEFHDIEFRDDIVYLATSDGLKVMNISKLEINNITNENLDQGISGIEVGQKSNKLYLTSGNKTIIFDPLSNITEIIDINETVYHLAIDKNEEVAFVGNHYKVYKLNLTDGTYHLYYPGMEPMMGVGSIDIADILYYSNSNSFIFNENNGLLTTNSALDKIPENQNSIASLFIDQKTDELFYVTGYFDNGAGCSLEWSNEFPRGVMIYDIKNNTQENYSIEHGLPSDMLISVTYDSVRNNVHLIGERFYSVVNKEELEKNITRKKVPSVVFKLTETTEVVGFKGEEDHIIIYVGIAGIGIITTIGFSLILEPSKYKLMLTFATPLYTRLEKEKILKHETRGRIREKIENDPGIHYNELKKYLKINNGALAYHLQVLEREKFIQSKNVGRFKYFFPATMKLPKRFFKMNEIQKIIFKKLIKSPGISQKKLAEEIGSSTSTVNYNIRILHEKGIISIIKEENKIKYTY